MVKRNETFCEFQKSYLFVEIANRKKKYLESNPNAKLISLGIGDTTEPIPPHISNGLRSKADKLSTLEGYSGYPEYNGSQALREKILECFYPNMGITPEEIFVSDGSKPDLARLQLLFSKETTVAVQDPVYPAYVDGCVISGKGGKSIGSGRYSNIVYMSCTPENNFFPNLNELPRTDLIFMCSPNNPTGTALSRKQLEQLVQFAKKNKSIIIYDAAYSMFISDSNDKPTTIFSIEGAKEVALETNSFSKFAGFTGVRLGWTICPKQLKYDDGSLVLPDWSRIMGTCFNGPSNIAEAGGIATLDKKGIAEAKLVVNYYMENAKIIKLAMEALGFECFGGKDSPYIWIRVPGKDSWDMFQQILEQAHVVTTPGAGFGLEGKNFLRISAFAHRSDVEEAVKRLKIALAKQ